MKRLILIFILCMSITISIISQDIDTPPFVSAIRTSVIDNKVMLSWRNPVNFSKELVVLRSTMVIDSDQIMAVATVVAVLKNYEQQYIDSPETGTWYYAVVVSEKDGKLENNRLYMHRNYTTKGIDIRRVPLTGLSSIKAEVINNTVNLSWTYDSTEIEEMGLIIKRHTVPISSIEVAESSISIARITTTTRNFIDVPVPNIRYYYAVLFDKDRMNKYIPSVSYTENPVNVNSRTEVINDFSFDNFIPLPLITLDVNPLTGEKFDDPLLLKRPGIKNLTNQSKSALNKHRQVFADVFNEFMREKYSHNRIQFSMLEDEDLFLSLNPTDEYMKIISIIRSNSRREAIPMLESYIAEPLSDQMLSRLGYYLGALYYEAGDYYKAYIFLIMGYNNYKKECIRFFSSIYHNIYENVKK